MSHTKRANLTPKLASVTNRLRGLLPTVVIMNRIPSKAIMIWSYNIQYSGKLSILLLTSDWHHKQLATSKPLTEVCKFQNPVLRQLLSGEESQAVGVTANWFMLDVILLFSAKNGLPQGKPLANGSVSGVIKFWAPPMLYIWP